MLLQQADVEDIMEARAVRQLDAISDAADALQHAEGPSPARPQFVLGTRVQRLRRAVKEAQLDPRSHVELHLPVVGVIVLLRKLPSLNKALMDLSQHLVTAAKKSIRSLSTCCPQPIWQDGRRGTAVHNLEGRRAEGGMEGRVIAILRP